jgi:nitroreductase
MTVRANEPREADFPTQAPQAAQLRFLLGYAVLAPSTHNTQPWLFVLRDDTVELYADYQRVLPGVDAQGRELIISCGVALVYLRLAIRHFGYAAPVDLCPQGEEGDLLARIALGARCPSTAAEDRLFHALGRRHTHRLPFSRWSVSQALRDELQAAVAAEGARLTLVQDSAPRWDLTDLVADADRAQWADPQFRQDKAAWVRLPPHAQPDGIPSTNLGLGELTAYLASGRSPGSSPGEEQASRDRPLVAGAPLLAVLDTAGDTRRDWLLAGQALGRLLLGAAAAGVSASFLNQPIQVAGLRPHLSALVGADRYPQLLLRLGYGHAVPLAPRRPVEDVLREPQA